MASDTEMGDDTGHSYYPTKRRFGNLWPGPPRPGTGTGLRVETASSPPVSSTSNGSRRSSLANLVHNLDVSDTNGVEHVVEEEDEDDDEDTEGEGEAIEGAEDDEEDEEEDEEEEGEGEDDDEEEDDESSDSETEEDPERGRSTASKPTSFAEPTPSISINGVSDTAAQIPVTAPVPSSFLNAAPSATSISTPLQKALADAINSAGLSNEASSSTATVKPKSKKPRKHRTPSPSPPPVVPPPPVRTIRLEIVLGGPSNYEVDISRRAKDTGQKEASPPPPLGFPEPEEDQKVQIVEELEGPPKKKKRRVSEYIFRRPQLTIRKKKGPAQEYYDTSDPFIDDSELAVDQRTYFAQTKQQGFYVSSGEVALMKDKNAKKPKSKKAAAPALGGGDGTRDSPIALVEDDASEGAFVNIISKGIKGVGIVSSSGVIGGHIVKDGTGKGDAMEEEGDEKTGQKRKRYITVVEGGKKRKIVNIVSFRAYSHLNLIRSVEFVPSRSPSRD